MIEIKRNCSSSIKDRGDYVTFGDFTIRISGDFYIKLMEIRNQYDYDLQQALMAVIYRGLNI